MPSNTRSRTNEDFTSAPLADLYPLAEQASRVLSYLAEFPESFSRSDSELAAQIGRVSAQQVAMVRRMLLGAGLAQEAGFISSLVASNTTLRRLAVNLEGVAGYLRIHKDRDTVQLVLTEPGERSALRGAIDRSNALPPLVFQTSDAFISLARAAKHALTVLVPFMDDQGAEFLLTLFALCGDGVERHLICRPLSEPHCGGAYRRRHSDFRRLDVAVYEYALPSKLPSGRETFHAKVVLADDSAFYVGSSNFMGSALERSLECGVIVRGESARQLHCVLRAIRCIATRAF
jgi:phosphatidylserine/phosphatidylglycerophosphate/cardiolipin synthase-like enzyme